MFLSSSQAQGLYSNLFYTSIVVVVILSFGDTLRMAYNTTMEKILPAGNSTHHAYSFKISKKMCTTAMPPKKSSPRY